MTFTTKHRVFIIKKLAMTINDMDQQDGFLFLKEYTKQEKKSEEGDYHDPFRDFYFSYSYIVQFIQGLDDTVIFEMYKDLFPEEMKELFVEKKPAYHLSIDKLILFFSHSHKDLKLVSSVKTILESTGWIECFVAHKDIDLAKEWEQEIKQYLECCHCLVAFLSKDFKSSSYCDQEIGVAIHRSIPICPFALDDTVPYGFIKHLQAKSFSVSKDLADKIEEYIFKTESLYQVAQPKFEKTVEILKSNFLSSTNSQMAESVLDQLMVLKEGQIAKHLLGEIQKNWKQNNKIREVKDIDRKMEQFLQKHSKIQALDEQNSHKKPSLGDGRYPKIDMDIDLRKTLERKIKKNDELPF